MEFGSIYVIRNIVNNKVYIGQTSADLNRRFNEHIRRAKNRPDMNICKAMNKYGSDKFYIEELERCPIDVIDEKEKYYIKMFDSVNSGYNVSDGGKVYIPKRPEIDINRLIKLYVEDGWTLDKVGKEFGITRHVARSILVANNIEIREFTSKIRHGLDIDKIRELRKSNSIRKTAKILGFSYGTLRDICIKWHIE